MWSKHICIVVHKASHYAANIPPVMSGHSTIVCYTLHSTASNINNIFFFANTQMMFRVFSNTEMGCQCNYSSVVMSRRKVINLALRKINAYHGSHIYQVFMITFCFIVSSVIVIYKSSHSVVLRMPFFLFLHIWDLWIWVDDSEVDIRMFEQDKKLLI